MHICKKAYIEYEKNHISSYFTGKKSMEEREELCNMTMKLSNTVQIAESQDIN